jgi:hypothetical protein
MSLFQQCNARRNELRTGAPYARRAYFERLEDRSLLSVTLSLDGLQTPVVNPNINVSQEALDALSPLLSSETIQSEMTLDVNPTNPLNIVGFAHRITQPDPQEIEHSVIDVLYTHNGGQDWFATPIDYSVDLFGTSDNPGGRFDPAIAFDASGKLYVAYSWRRTVNVVQFENKLIVGQSQDGGETFRFSVAAQNNSNEFHTPRLATGVDPYNDDDAVYVAYSVANEFIGGIGTNAIRLTGSNQLDASENFEFEAPRLVMESPTSQSEMFIHNETFRVSG